MFDTSQYIKIFCPVCYVASSTLVEVDHDHFQSCLTLHKILISCPVCYVPFSTLDELWTVIIFPRVWPGKFFKISALFVTLLYPQNFLPCLLRCLFHIGWSKPRSFSIVFDTSQDINFLPCLLRSLLLTELWNILINALLSLLFSHYCSLLTKKGLYEFKFLLIWCLF